MRSRLDRVGWVGWPPVEAGARPALVLPPVRPTA
jgi:hypothetical protein